MSFSSIPTSKDVAALVGCSPSTVSRAFNHHSDLSDAMRQRVLSVARTIGYKPNPALSALTRKRWSKGHQSECVVIAFLWPSRDKVQHPDYALPEFVSRAEELGYVVRHFALDEYKDAKALDRHFHRLGITAITTNLPMASLPYAIALDNYYHVSFFNSPGFSHLNHVRYDWQQTVDMVTREAVAAGYRRVGYVTNSINVESEERALKSAYYLNREELQQSHGRQPEVLVFDFLSQPYAGTDFSTQPVEFWKDNDVLRWYRREMPDVIIASESQTYHMLKMSGVRFPEDCGYITLRAVESERHLNLSGVDMQKPHSSALAADLLHHLIQTGQRGILRFPFIQLVEGVWCPGRTIRNKKARSQSNRASKR